MVRITDLFIDLKESTPVKELQKYNNKKNMSLRQKMSITNGNLTHLSF